MVSVSRGGAFSWASRAAAGAWAVSGCSVSAGHLLAHRRSRRPRACAPIAYRSRPAPAAAKPAQLGAGARFRPRLASGRNNTNVLCGGGACVRTSASCSPTGASQTQDGRYTHHDTPWKWPSCLSCFWGEARRQQNRVGVPFGGLGLLLGELLEAFGVGLRVRRQPCPGQRRCPLRSRSWSSAASATRNSSISPA